jgi:hypothetical protein
MGTGIGTLMPTMPTSIFCTKACAVPPSRVKQATPLAKLWRLISSTAAAKVGTRTTHSTGPKISSR